MPSKSKPEPAEVYRCTEAFSVWEGQVPTVYGEGQEVLGDHPILKSHRAFFTKASDAIRGIEQATAAPGERRSVVLTAEKENSNG